MQESGTDNASTSVARRPCPFRARPDLIVSEVMFRGVPHITIKDPIGLKYAHLQPEQYKLLTLLDGRRTLAELAERLRRAFPGAHITASDVQQIATDLRSKGFLNTVRSGQGETLVCQRIDNQRKKIIKTISNPLFLRFPPVDADRALAVVDRLLGWVLSRPFVFLGSLFIAGSWLQVAIRFDALQRQVPEFHQFFGWPNLLYLWATLGFAKVIHEFGHGLACRRFGAECHGIGFAFLVSSPTLYCDATDSWMLPNKWHRMAIGAAGMYVEVLLAAVAIFLWSISTPGLFNHLCLNLFFVSAITTVIFNANPLIKFDGYYILSDALEIPNLREKASLALQRVFAWCVGLELPKHPLIPDTGRFWFAIYAIASAVYRWFITAGIVLVLYQILKPYRLQSLGLSWACFSVAMLVWSLLMNAWRTLKQPRQAPVNRRRLATTLIVTATAFVLVCLIPLPVSRTHECYVQPTGVVRLSARVPGRLAEILRQAGESVHQDELLASLVNPDVDDALREQKQVLELATQDYANARATRDAGGMALAEQQQSGARRSIDKLNEWNRQLQLRAPASGTIVAAGLRPTPKLEISDSQPKTWTGHALTQQNVGTWLEANTEICSIAPTDDVEAVLLLSQEDRLDVREGMPVSLKFDSLPATTLTGTLSRLSDRPLEFAPPGMSNKTGGRLATVTDQLGRERLPLPVYEAHITITTPANQSLRHNMRGQVRFQIAKRSLAGWVWRYAKRTFSFDL